MENCHYNIRVFLFNFAFFSPCENEVKGNQTLQVLQYTPHANIKGFMIHIMCPEADLRKKASLATNQEGPFLPPFLPFPSSSLPSFPFPSRPLPLEVGPPFAARGSGGALKLPQRVRAEPGRQTHFGAF